MVSSLDVPDELNGLSGLYNSPDPLLRRLRFNDTNGKPILDVDDYFKNKEVLVLYAGSGYGSNNLKELHKNLSRLALQQIKSCAVLYVSTDMDAKVQKSIVENVPWLALEFADNSDFASIGNAKDEQSVEIEDIARGEDFIQAGELEIGAEKVVLGVEEYASDYVRPLSRAALTVLMKVYATPSISIYHIPSHTIIQTNVRQTSFYPQNIDKIYHTWRNGGEPSMRLKDALIKMRFPLLVLLVALSYRLFVILYGQEYDVIPKIMENLTFKKTA